MAPNPPLMSQLAKEISLHTETITKYIEHGKWPHPSFDADGPPHPIPEAEAEDKLSAARDALIEATKALHALAVGPTETTRFFCTNEINLVGAMQVLCKFNVPQHVPIQGDISLRGLSGKTDMGEALLSRFLRMAAANYYFSEPRPGFFAHTAWSRLLASDEKMRACIWCRHAEMVPAVAKLPDAVERFPESAEPQETAFGLAFGDTFFGYKEKNPEHMVKFGLFVDAFAGGNAVDSAESIARAYAWGQLPRGSLVVDVGGGIGHISAAIARQHAHLEFNIQDFGDLAGESSALLEQKGVSDRARFSPHNFFDPQPEAARGAAVYFLRNILHNWSDPYCHRILKPIVEAMDHGSRIVICDIVLPEPNTIPKTQEAQVRALDLIMLSMFNAKERSHEDWQELFTSVDPRLKITAVVGRPELRRDCLIEARLVQPALLSK
ncbi:S-adenosyl-L-methionine-dependent methyltransferase [Trichocladium antarcticum]|uniref:S-adenosyl-L-methionine-dependent methyltransferase n=1 Tax=Trichocladium antarcticum TaxID=1450529 RepID=A0AAN6USJ7_9PEZI|nr:S-adenosyl-L-methionine-dependent methyltransferase [Trichocladium antarcticum]